MTRVEAVLKKQYREISANLTWQAVYPDKTVNQYNEDETQNSYDMLNRDDMTSFNLVDDKGNIVVNVSLGEDKKLFYRMRVAFFVGSRSRQRIWLVGWQKREGTMITRQIFVVDTEGKVKTYKDFKENSQWLYAPQFREFEEV